MRRPRGFRLKGLYLLHRLHRELAILANEDDRLGSAIELLARREASRILEVFPEGRTIRILQGPAAVEVDAERRLRLHLHALGREVGVLEALGVERIGLEVGPQLAELRRIPTRLGHLFLGQHRAVVERKPGVERLTLFGGAFLGEVPVKEVFPLHERGQDSQKVRALGLREDHDARGASRTRFARDGLLQRFLWDTLHAGKQVLLLGGVQVNDDDGKVGTELDHEILRERERMFRRKHSIYCLFCQYSPCNQKRAIVGPHIYSFTCPPACSVVSFSL